MQLPMNKKKILLIEDNETGGLLISSLFEEREEIELHIVTNGKKALEFVYKNTLSLILMDIMLPDINGLEILRQLKEDEKTKDIPVIMVSAFDKKEFIAAAKETGAIDFITKPVGINHLYERVLKVLLDDKTEEEDK